MGYYTAYNLQICGDCSRYSKDKVEAEIERMNVFESGNFEDGYYAYEKWYYNNDDMLLLSHRFPELTFILTGDGDESDDFWRMYYRDGKMMGGLAEIVFPEFDPSKLAPPEDTSFFKTTKHYHYEEEDDG